MKTSERDKYNKWVMENYPETYSLRHTEEIKSWLGFGYIVWLNAKDDLSRELLGHAKVK